MMSRASLFPLPLATECDLALLRFRKICVINELLPLLGGLGLF